MRKIIGIAVACATLAATMFTMTACGGGMPYNSYDLNEYIKVGEYKGLPAREVKVEVTNQDMGERIDQMMEAATKQVKLKKGTVVEEGDTVNIDYSGAIDGKKFEGGTAKGTDLTLGSNMFISDLENAIKGKRVGQKNMKLEVTFPEDYQGSEELQGKDAVFTVTINSATRPEKPEFNDAFAKSQGNYKSADELEKAVRKSLYEEKKANAVNEQKTKLWDKVVGNSKVKKYPQDEIDRYMKFNSEQMDAMAKEKDLTREEMLSKYGFRSEKDFRTQNEESTKLRVKQEMIIMKIAENEKISYDEDETSKMLSSLEKQGYDKDKIKEATGRSAEEYAHIQILYEKVLDYLYENSDK